MGRRRRLQAALAPFLRLRRALLDLHYDASADVSSASPGRSDDAEVVRPYVPFERSRRQGSLDCSYQSARVERGQLRHRQQHERADESQHDEQSDTDRPASFDDGGGGEDDSCRSRRRGRGQRLGVRVRSRLLSLSAPFWFFSSGHLSSPFTPSLPLRPGCPTSVPSYAPPLPLCASTTRCFESRVMFHGKIREKRYTSRGWDECEGGAAPVNKEGQGNRETRGESDKPTGGSSERR